MANVEQGCLSGQYRGRLGTITCKRRILRVQKTKTLVETEHKFPILLFDGVCNLCNASVQWVLQRDRAGRIRFASLQSQSGQELLARFQLDRTVFDTVVLVDGDRVFTRSDAALELLRQLGKPWSLLHIFHRIPRPLRNAVYDWIARHRYRWFGRREECWLPRPEWKERFLS